MSILAGDLPYPPYGDPQPVAEEIRGGTERKGSSSVSEGASRTRISDETGLREKAELVMAARNGDERAQHELIVAYQRRVAGFVYSVVGRTDAVEDLTQTVFIKMIRSLGRLSHPDQFEAWLFRLAKNTCIDHVRRRKWAALFTPLEVEEHEPIAETPSDVSLDALDALRYALDQLRPADRALIALAQEGRSQDEMASVLKISLVALKARLHRAREQLKHHFRHGTE